VVVAIATVVVVLVVVVLVVVEVGAVMPGVIAAQGPATIIKVILLTAERPVVIAVPVVVLPVMVGAADVPPKVIPAEGPLVATHVRLGLLSLLGAGKRDVLRGCGSRSVGLVWLEQRIEGRVCLSGILLLLM